MADPKLIIEGTGRDYDFAAFCPDKHYAEACEFAETWVTELLDAIEIGEEKSVAVAFRKIDVECCECHPEKRYQDMENV